MPAVLNTNVASLWASKNLLVSQDKMANSVERLSSGLRINRARDDAAGLGVANSLTNQINGANQGIRNLNDGISLVQTAEGAMSAAQEMGQRILMLATQGANGTYNSTERSALRAEMQQLIVSINSIATRTNFSTNPLLNEAATATGVKYKIQISNTPSDTVDLDAAGFRSVGTASQYTYTAYTSGTMGSLAVSSNTTVYVDVAGVKVSKTLSKDSAGTAYLLDGVTFSTANAGTIYSQSVAAGDAGLAGQLSTDINAANSTATFQTVQSTASAYVTALSTQRSLLGAYQNQLEYTVSNVTTLSGNLSAAKSRVIDTDYAAETANLTKGQILQQAATAMLAQANQMPNVILTLLK
jgi:flagellin